LAAVVFALTVVSTAAPQNRSAQPGWHTHRVPSERFSIALPASWYALAARTPAFARTLRAVLAKNPSLAPLLRGLAKSSSPLKFIAVDLSAASIRSGFVTNLNVIDQPTFLSFDAWTRLNLTLLQRLPIVVGHVWQRRLRLPAGRALRLRYTERLSLGARTIRVAITQFLLVHTGTGYVLTFSTAPGRARAGAATFLRSAETLRFL
jgi:hypothetical protein